MLFSSTEFLTVALSIVSCIAAFPTPLERRLPSRQVIGWRVASGVYYSQSLYFFGTHKTISQILAHKQAARRKRAGAITPDKNEHGTQTSKGQYISPGIGQWIGKHVKEYVQTISLTHHGNVRIFAVTTCTQILYHHSQQ